MLVLAGEANFILPFVLPRIFRPTVLELFELNNTELGTCFSIYGVVALFSYLFGGQLADRFSPRYLMSISLLLTGLGGFYMATFPSGFYLGLLYGYWGFTTIFLFWAAMIKATRIWGGTSRQGLAFGLLDGGRGATSWLFGFLAISLFGLFLLKDINLSAFSEQKEAFSKVLQLVAAIIISVGVLVFFFMKDISANLPSTSSRLPWQDIVRDYFTVLRMPAVYLLMVIIVCAYTGYKITDIYSQYANEIMQYDQIRSAEIGRDLLGIRIFISVIIGLLADQTRSSLMMIIGFLLTLLGAFLMASGWIGPSTSLLFWTSIIITATGVYAFRTLYFSAIQEGHIPLAVTGTAVGLISLVGYTPDIFMGPAIGLLLDGTPGPVGFQHVFLMLAVFAVIGLIATILFHRLHKTPSTSRVQATI
ncbi:MFS transporter [Nonlabens xiamenensis]|uniref:MFS transporter n=1 Tax=Nonlabens xiamenensis TaxID=2341043 RepID=UPI001F0CBF92|nr:MFS transporter [Nonlabens xiamenensis]